LNGYRQFGDLADIAREQVPCAHRLSRVPKRAAEVRWFPGISAPYEASLKPEIELPTDKLSVAESVAKILAYLRLQDTESVVSI
jgi:hypothetical protein